SPDHLWLLVGYGGKFELIEMSSGLVDIFGRRSEKLASTPQLLAFSPDGAFVVAAAAPEPTDQHPKLLHRSGHIEISDAKTGKSLRSFDTENGAVSSLAIAPDSSTLAVGGEGFDLRFWDLKSGNETRQLPSEPASRGWLSDFSEHQHINVLAFS